MQRFTGKDRVEKIFLPVKIGNNRKNELLLQMETSNSGSKLSFPLNFDLIRLTIINRLKSIFESVKKEILVIISSYNIKKNSFP